VHAADGKLVEHSYLFGVNHYAGAVIYNATNFMEKNKDALADSLLNLLRSSTVHLLVTSEESAVGAKKSDNRLTLAAKFKNDLDSLMSTLRLTSPHFIRCIKPNNDQAPNAFDAHLVLNQLKYSGLFEAIRIRKAGYPIRMTHQQFIKRYKFTVTVSKKMSTGMKNDTRACCEWIAKELAQSLISQQSSSSSSTAIVKSKGSSSTKKPVPAPTMEELIKQWAVGTSKIFLRSQQLKSSFDELRKQSSSFAAIPIQSCVRLYLARRKYLLLMGDRLREREQRRRMEEAERDAMSKEDQISKESERLFRSDVVLQQQIIHAKQERARRELYMRQAQQFEAARNIQRIARGFVYKRRGRLVICERLLERSLLQRNDNQLRRAIELPQKYHVTSKLIKVYQESARKLILEVLHESYVQNELAEATEVQSVEMLRDAIKLAEQSNMLYLKGLRRAKVALENAQFLRSICSTIAGVLSKCVTVPKLVARADVLRYLLDRATSCGLGGEPKVQEAALRLRRVRNLIQLRDQFRFAVEICCPEKMKRFLN
jgi:myosin heavy subunit